MEQLLALGCWEDVDARFGGEWPSLGEDAAGEAFDVGWCSVRSQVHCGEGADGGAGGQRRTMMIFFTSSFLKEQIEARGRCKAQGWGSICVRAAAPCAPHLAAFLPGLDPFFCLDGERRIWH